MSMKKMRVNNSQEFFDDLNRVHDVMVLSSLTSEFFNIKKKDVKRAAETCKIEYSISNLIFRNRRDVMIIQ